MHYPYEDEQNKNLNNATLFFYTSDTFEDLTVSSSLLGRTRSKAKKLIKSFDVQWKDPRPRISIHQPFRWCPICGGSLRLLAVQLWDRKLLPSVSNSKTRISLHLWNRWNRWLTKVKISGFCWNSRDFHTLNYYLVLELSTWLAYSFVY